MGQGFGGNSAGSARREREGAGRFRDDPNLTRCPAEGWARLQPLGRGLGYRRGSVSLLPDLLKDLIRQLEGVMPAERRELRARIGGLEKRFRDAGVADERALKAVDKAIRRSSEELARRRTLVPPVTYPPELPVTAAIDALRDAVAANQVVIVAGETGSGKSTQLPKLCLELGRGVLGRIGHTQPRRIAARSIARRVAEELGVKPGGVVGVKVRFGDESGRDTLVKVLTDGMLLAETRSDARLASP